MGAWKPEEWDSSDWDYYYFLTTLSRLLEKEDVGWTWYDGPHLINDSIFADLYEKYLEENGKPFNGKRKTSNSSS